MEQVKHIIAPNGNNKGTYKTESNKLVEFSLNDISNNNLRPNSGLNIENLFIDFEYKKGKYKLKSIFKNVFGNETDNFHIRYYKSDYYVHYLKSESKVLTFFEPPVFSEQLIKDIAFKQLISSQALCKGIPIRTECYVNLDKSNFEYSPLNGFANDWRMVVGKGISSVFESGMSIHHTYGIPYIPASAVKGILRSWIISEYFSNNGNDLEKAECRALRNFDFCKIFGTQEKTTFIKDKKVICEAISPLKNIKNETTEHIGNIVFFDAFPTKVPTVSVDIMNPHYPKYYNHDAGSDDFQPPADWQSPVPIFFLTVKDTSFQFLFGIRKDVKNFDNVCFKNEDKEHKGNPIEVLKKILIEALTYQGIGAKTAVGYGRMTET